ncbi:targeting protein for Xklp2 [Corythoichthys intestinalis]|uniref:targeting protein for Xklp2 n=1 Tax=Corythoichthys intestinalis TaxID=161448 RepID=UPI0025A6435E|nr:targeting protein for Xklp2 [Corythoichthys intestinalis]
MAEAFPGDPEKRYEFDAPSHVDFNQLDNETCDNTWFDRRAIVDQALETPKRLATEGPTRIVKEAAQHAIDPQQPVTVGPIRVLKEAVSTAADSKEASDSGARPKISSDQPRRVSKRLAQSRYRPYSKKSNNAKETSEYVKNEEDQNSDGEPQLTSLKGFHQEPSKTTCVPEGGSVTKPGKRLQSKKKTAIEDTYLPVAQHIMQLQKRTPQRFHKLSLQERAKGPPKGKSQRLRLTRPQSPKFATRLRSRAPVVKSSAQIEAEEEVARNKSNFKAQELNKHILERREPVKKPAAKEPTIQEAFTMHIEKRIRQRAASKPKDESEFTFKANELPKKILEGVVGVPEKKVKDLTVAQSPAFKLPKKAHVEVKAEEVKPRSLIKHTPVPQFGTPFQPMLKEKRQTEVCPFSFEQREQEKRKLKDIRERDEEEVPVFKAKPLPHFETVSLPEKKKLEPTKPEPFRLIVDERGAAKNERWEQMVKEDQKKMKEVSTFKARPNKVTQKEPFQPKKENRAAVVVESFELATEQRARDREEYYQYFREQEAIAALVEEQRRQEEEEKEKLEIAQMRQQQVHKAQPIRHYKTVEVKKSDVPLTVPKSPNFSVRL